MKKQKIRCFHCKKKIKNLISEYKCKCDSIFCSKCRYPSEHNCTFNFFKENQKKIMEENKLICGDKLIKI